MNNEPTESQQPAPWRGSLSAAGLVACVWIGCGLAGFALRSLGNAYGCHLDSGVAHPCLILGLDLGAGIYSLAVGLLLIAGFGTPLFLLAILSFLGFALFKFALHIDERNRSVPPAD
jgi:hypothetical protein